MKLEKNMLVFRWCKSPSDLLKADKYSDYTVISIFAASYSGTTWLERLPLCLCLRLEPLCCRWTHRTFLGNTKEADAFQDPNFDCRMSFWIQGCCLFTIVKGSEAFREWQISLYGAIYNSSMPHLTHLHPWISVGQSFWSMAFFLSRNRFQVGSAFRACTRERQ